VVAVNVFRESVRDRVPYNLVVFAVLLIGSSYLIGQLTAGQDVKIIKDLGLAATSVFGLFISIFIGIGLVSKEVERRSIYALLSKPVSRSQFIVGKYAGLVLTLAVNVSVMAIALYVILAYMVWTEPPTIRAGWDAPGMDPALLKAVFLIFIELMLVTAIALFFSTFSTPILSAALTFGFYIVGHFNADLKNFEKVVSSKAAGQLARGAYHVLPDLSAVRVRPKWCTVCGNARIQNTAAYAACNAALLLVSVHLLGRTSNEATRDTVVVLAQALRGCVSLQIMRDRCAPARRCRAQQILYVDRRGEADSPLFDAVAHLLSRDSTLRRGPGGPRRRPSITALPAARSHDTLDPYFNIAYRFGAIFLAGLSGRSGRPEQSVALLQKAITVSPSGSITTTSGSCITGACATTRQRRPGFSVPPARLRTPNWLQPLVFHARARTTVLRRVFSGSRSPSRWLRPKYGAVIAAAPGDGSDRPARGRRQTFPRRR
jgi:hypothetical protein